MYYYATCIDYIFVKPKAHKNHKFSAISIDSLTDKCHMSRVHIIKRKSLFGVSIKGSFFFFSASV